MMPKGDHRILAVLKFGGSEIMFDRFKKPGFILFSSLMLSLLFLVACGSSATEAPQAAAPKAAPKAAAPKAAAPKAESKAPVKVAGVTMAAPTAITGGG